MNERDKHLTLAIELADAARELTSEGAHEAARTHASVAQAYAAIAGAWGDYATTQPVPEQAAPLPEWCGKCESPERGQRWVQAPVRPGEEKYEPRLMRCPKCDPASDQYKAAHADVTSSGDS